MLDVEGAEIVAVAKVVEHRANDDGVGVAIDTLRGRDLDSCEGRIVSSGDRVGSSVNRIGGSWDRICSRERRGEDGTRLGHLIWGTACHDRDRGFRDGSRLMPDFLLDDNLASLDGGLDVWTVTPGLLDRRLEMIDGGFRQLQFGRWMLGSQDVRDFVVAHRGGGGCVVETLLVDVGFLGQGDLASRSATRFECYCCPDALLARCGLSLCLVLNLSFDCSPLILSHNHWLCWVFNSTVLPFLGRTDRACIVEQARGGPKER